jgi:hypothetical protein
MKHCTFPIAILTFSNVNFQISIYHRLWGDHGQVALEKAKICLINASATGTEILKNLILPGVMY